MTRRKIYFFDKENKKLYCTPEFNGDKSEFAFLEKEEIVVIKILMKF